MGQGDDMQVLNFTLGYFASHVICHLKLLLLLQTGLTCLCVCGCSPGAH